MWFPAACQTFPKHGLSLSVVRECSFWVLNAATQWKILYEPGSNSKLYSVLSDWNLLPREIKKDSFNPEKSVAVVIQILPFRVFSEGAFSLVDHHC